MITPDRVALVGLTLLLHACLDPTAPELCGAGCADAGATPPSGADAGASAPSPDAAPNALYPEGSGTEGDPWIISSFRQLDGVRRHLDASFALGEDLYLPEAPFTPLGACDGNRTGAIAGRASARLGQPALLDGVHLDQCDVMGNTEVGGLVGQGVALELTHTSGQQLFVRGVAGVGGLVGDLFDGAIRHSAFGGQLGHSFFSIREDGGGVAGRVADDARLESLDVADLSVFAGARVGGLVGQMRGGRIEDAAVDGQLNAICVVGGLVGQLIGPEAYIARAYSISRLSGQRGAGGLVGEMSGGRVESTFCAGPLSALPDHELPGGAIGHQVDGQLADVYWDNALTGRDSCTSVGSDEGCVGHTGQAGDPSHWYSSEHPPLTALENEGDWVFFEDGFPLPRSAALRRGLIDP